MLFDGSLCLADEIKDSLFWEAEGHDRKIFILGVTHDGFTLQYPIGVHIIKALERSSLYVTESSLAYADTNEVERRLKVQYEPGPRGTLGTLIDGKECILSKVENLDRKVNAILGDDVMRFYRGASPRALVHQLYERGVSLSQEQRASMGLAMPIEYFLTQQARKMDKGYSGLDPEYWDSLDALSDGELCNLISSLVRHESEGKEKSIVMRNAIRIASHWREGKSAEMQRIFFEESDKFSTDHGKAHRKWFDSRNKNMVGKIVGLHSKEMFVVVGAAHLSGESGILALLREHGFIVTPKNMH